MTTLYRSALCFASCGVLVAACLGGQTGQEDRQSQAMMCDYERTALEANEATPLGFTAAQLEDVLSGMLSSSVRWSRMGTTTALTVELLEVRARRLRESAVETCFDAIELDVTVLIATEDGLLHEEVEGTVTAQALEGWMLNAQLAFEAIAGTLDASDLELDLSHWQAPHLAFRLSRYGLLPDGEGVTLGGQILLDGGDPNSNDSQSPVSAFIANVTP